MSQLSIENPIEYLSKKTTNAIKGILELVILIHHIYKSVDILHVPGLSLVMEAPIGYWAVALFFFFSGYGLWSSYCAKGTAYIRSFPRRRILPFYLIILLLTGLYILINLTLSDAKEISFSTILRSCTWGYTIIKNGWYFQVQLLLYICFFIVSILVKDTKRALAILTGVTAVYIAVCVFLRMDAYWYQSVPAFVLGLFWSENRERINIFVKKAGWGKATLIAVFLFFLFFAGSLVLNRMGLISLCIVLRIVSIILFVVSFTLFLMRLSRPGTAENRFLAYLGSISMGVYAMQGVFLLAFRGTVISISNDWLYSAAVITATLLSAAVVTPLFRLIYSAFKK